MNNDFNKDYLMHYGVLGMKWGVRRYQRKDGSLTSKGKQHISEISKKRLKKDERFKKKNPRAYERISEEQKEMINSQKKWINQNKKDLDMISNPSKEKLEKQARKEIEDEKDLLKEEYLMGDGGYKNPTDQDALNSLFWRMGEDGSRATFNNYVEELSKQYTNNQSLKEYSEKSIKRSQQIIDEIGNMTVYELYEEAGKYSKRPNRGVYDIVNNKYILEPKVGQTKKR
jgi:hypothetical protein